MLLLFHLQIGSTSLVVVAVEVFISACKLVCEVGRLCFKNSAVSPRFLEYPTLFTFSTWVEDEKSCVLWLLLGHVLRLV